MGNHISITHHHRRHHRSICDSLAAAVFGCLLFVGTIAWSAWSEGHYVTQVAVLESARAAAQEFPCDSPDIVGTPPNELIFLEGCTMSNLPTWTECSNVWMRSSRGWSSTTRAG